MNDGLMPTPCANCEDIVDFRLLTEDPLDEYDMVCLACAYDRRKQAEEMRDHDYEHKMPDYQKRNL